MARRVTRLERAKKDAPAKKRESCLRDRGEKGELLVVEFAELILGNDGCWRNAMALSWLQDQLSFVLQGT